MFRLFSTTARTQAGRLNLRRFAHDVGGRVLIMMKPCIDISKPPPPQALLTVSPRAKVGPDKEVEKVAPTLDEKSKVPLSRIGGRIALAAGAILIARDIRKRWKSIERTVVQMKQTVSDAPNLEQLKEDERAMDDHLQSLLHTWGSRFLSPQLDQKIAGALVHYRARGDGEKAEIEAVCRKLQDILKREDLPPQAAYFATSNIIMRFLKPVKSLSSDPPGATVSESTDFSQDFSKLDQPPTDNPSLQ
ncbi:hypothetical protein DFH09DRAFT_1137234 [Mycena vulgaris]|nr:hypothetical protein DFH09DRAFT_1137234 [Mycena vulgaris]